VGVSFDNDTKILSLHVWSIGPDGHEYEVKDKEMTEHGYGEGHLFEDDKVRVATPLSRDPGGVVAYEYEQRCHPYLTEKTWFFQGHLPHLNQTFTLELPLISPTAPSGRTPNRLLPSTSDTSAGAG
jgi:hypothetical protein